MEGVAAGGGGGGGREVSKRSNKGQSEKEMGWGRDRRGKGGRF